MGSVGSFFAHITATMILLIYKMTSKENKNNPKLSRAHANEGKSNTIVARKFIDRIVKAKHWAMPHGH